MSKYRNSKPFPNKYQKNSEGRIIIIYDNDEKVTVGMGNLFFEKGIDNVMILSGGLHAFVEKYEDFVTGTLPDVCIEKKKQKEKLEKTKKPGSASSGLSAPITTGQFSPTNSTVSSAQTFRSATSASSTMKKKGLMATTIHSKPWK